MISKKVSIAIGVLATAIAVYVFTGFFIIQPIGAAPDGATLWYFRFGYNLPFVCSADGMLMKQGKGVSILGRAIVMGTILEKISDRKIVRLPYSETMYLMSTGGTTFDK